jgi:leader peptidase (prepilin peptidase) / N-methyltransferase
VNILDVEYLAVLVALFVLGSVIGSLLNVCIHRLPREERFWIALRSLFYPPSHCPRCERQIPFYDNIPIFGWIMLGGRCRGCRGRIAIRYPLIELLTASLFVLVYWCEIPSWWGGTGVSGLAHVYGPSGTIGSSWMSPLALLHWRYALHMLLIVMLLVATFIDFDLRIIPDAVTLPAMMTALAAHTLLGRVFIVPLWYQTPEMRGAFPADLERTLVMLPNAPPLPEWFTAWARFAGVPGWMTAWPSLHGLLLSLAGVLAGGGIVWAVRIAGQWGFRREVMGFGDVVLLATIGGFLGWQGALAVFVLAPFCALLAVVTSALVRFDREVPYGPYLSLATLLLLVGWRWIWPTAEAFLALGPFLVLAGGGMLLALAGLLSLTRLVQRALGLRGDDELPLPTWTSGDQLSYRAGECRNDRQGEWRRPRWDGELSSRGLLHENQWRGP